MSLSKLRELVMDSEVWRAAVHRVTKSQTWLSDWIELKRAEKGVWWNLTGSGAANKESIILNMKYVVVMKKKQRLNVTSKIIPRTE